jgi:hypothetical protein
MLTLISFSQICGVKSVLIAVTESLITTTISMFNGRVAFMHVQAVSPSLDDRYYLWVHLENATFDLLEILDFDIPPKRRTDQSTT